MGVPTSEVGYTSAMPRREDDEVHKDMWGGGTIYYDTSVVIFKIYLKFIFYISSVLHRFNQQLHRSCIVIHRWAHQKNCTN